MARLTPRPCENYEECRNMVIPKPNATRARFCSGKCKQKIWRKEQKQAQLAKARTMTIEQAIGYQWLEEIIPAMNDRLEKFGALFGHSLCVSAMQMIGDIGLMLKEATEQCAKTTT